MSSMAVPQLTPITQRDPDYQRSGFFQGPYATFLRNFVKIGEEFLHNPANKQTNTDENMTSLAEGINIHQLHLASFSNLHFTCILH